MSKTILKEGLYAIIRHLQYKTRHNKAVRGRASVSSTILSENKAHPKGRALF